MSIQLKKFDELSLQELYNILSLRNDIFIVEQNCPYQDIDGKDQESLHLWHLDVGKIAGYLRIIPGNVPAIGRVVVARESRMKGIARKLMSYAIQHISEELGKERIYLQAQVYLKAFYQSLGFEAVSEEYLEDDIPHVDMRLLIY